jgi:hypothetical protein
MNERRVCAEREALIGFLYGETDELEKRRVERHIEVCASCAVEVGELRSVQEQLPSWEAPEVPLGFRVVPDPATTSVWKAWQLPAWLQAAAAVFLVAGAAAVANLDVRYGAEGFVIRTGWSARAPEAASDASVQWRAELAALEQRMRRDLSAPAPVDSALIASITPAPGQPAGAGTASSRDADVIRQVRELVQASERKQQQELALRMAQLARDVDMQRRADLVRIEQGLGQIEGQTGAAIAQQREWLDQLVRVSAQGR